MTRFINFLALSVILAAFFGCVSAPYTQRKQFILISGPEESELGLQAFQQVKKESRLSQDPAAIDLVTRVGRRIAQAADRPDYDWEFVVINDPKTVNAFCLPGGKVAFYTGILPVCKGEAGVAVVMGHEVSHALARHGAERISQGELAQLGQKVLAVAVSERSPEAQQGIMTAYGLGAQVSVLLPFSRTQESEADHIGLILMAKAGYDPRAAVSFWQRMAQLSKGQAPPEFLATHPGDEKRVQHIEEWLPEALKYYKSQ